MKELKTEQVQVKLLAMGMVLLAVLLLAPLFAIAHYSVKCVDDFVYFKNPEALWQSTHSLYALIKAQTLYAIEYWKTWQGTYFSEWLITIIMGICGDKYYFVGAYLAIGGLVSGELLLFKVIFVNILSADWGRTLIVSLSCILLQILLMPSPAEAFFWFCGTGLYTWIYVLAAVLTALVLDAVCRRLKGWKAAVREAGILLLAFAVGGSNYVIALLIFVIWGAGLLLLWLYRHRDRVMMTVNFLFYLGCMLLSVCAVGNQQRLNASNMEGYSVLESIIRSVWEAMLYLCQWTVLPYIVAGLMLAPVMIGIVKKRKYRYPLPFLATAITFGMFAAQFTPNLYTLGIIGAGRVQNLYRMTMLIWLYGNELYWIGWLMWRKERQDGGQATSMPEKESETSWLLAGWCAGLAVMTGSLCLWGGSTVTSVSAFLSLHRGEAQRYKAEYEARLEILRDETVRNAELAPYTSVPYVLYFGDIVSDPEDWVNRSVAHAFGKDSVVLKE